MKSTMEMLARSPDTTFYMGIQVEARHRWWTGDSLPSLKRCLPITKSRIEPWQSTELCKPLSLLRAIIVEKSITRKARLLEDRRFSEACLNWL